MTTMLGCDSTAAVAERIREARATGTTLRLVGAGGWLDAGRPCPAEHRVELRPLAGVTEYEAGDLTLTARAGTTLSEIERATAPEGQWLTLDPFGSADGTIGATVATASHGPLSSSYGTPRDHLLGCESVSGTGDVIRSGGRVVKNVAGFDLPRLMCGAWGTLGVLTEITVRLRARPEVDRTLVVALRDESAGACADAWRWLRASPFTPLAAELLSASIARRLGLGERAVLALRLGGNEALVRSAERTVAELGDVRTVAGSLWDDLRRSEPSGSVVIRLGALPADIGSLWAAAGTLAERAGGFAHSTLGRGVVRCVVPIAELEEDNGRLWGIIGQLQAAGSRIFERLPSSLWSGIPSPASDPISRGVRRAFDPDHLLNPGILGESA
jgi:glycolate oxidase FAD binding subunit